MLSKLSSSWSLSSFSSSVMKLSLSESSSEFSSRWIDLFDTFASESNKFSLDLSWASKELKKSAYASFSRDVILLHSKSVSRTRVFWIDDDDDWDFLFEAAICDDDSVFLFFCLLRVDLSFFDML